MSLSEHQKEMEFTIRTFAKQLSGYICIYDYLKRFPLPIDLVSHQVPYCIKVKSDNRLFEKCVNCDVQMTRGFLESHQEPFIKRCHQNIIEISVPIFYHNQIVGLIIWGAFRDSGEKFSLPELKQSLSRKNFHDDVTTFDGLPFLSEELLQDQLILIRLLELKLHQYLDLTNEIKIKEKGHYGIINHFFLNHFTKKIQIQDLAKELNLSESRTTQLLKIHFNKSFPLLLKEFRLEYAKSLLENTLYSMTKIAELCGFSDQGYFHKCFKETVNMTPTQFRVSRQKIKKHHF